MFIVDEAIDGLCDVCPALSMLLGEKALFLDIETTGLSARNAGLYLIGVIFKKDGAWRYRQWFVDTVLKEKEMLQSFSEFACSYDTLVTFNGNTFDLPFLRACEKQYHMELGLADKKRVDLYVELRPLKKLLGMTSLKQKAFEERMGIFREDKFSGGELIDVYKNYVKEPSDEVKELLLLHNRDDLLGMLKVAELLNFERIFDGSFVLKSMYVDEESSRVRMELVVGEEFKSPMGVTYAYSCACDVLDKEAGSEEIIPDFGTHMEEQIDSDFKVCMEGENITLDLLQKEGCVKLFFSDYKNYFYLPDEDKAVHKSVGVYVDSHFRRKATFETAYQWVRLGLLKANPQQLDVFLHSLFEHYIFGGKKSK